MTPLEMKTEEIHKSIAKIHKKNMKYGFLSSFEVRFLALLYWAIDYEKDSVIFYEEKNGKVVGFIAGSLGMKAIFKRMLCRPVELLISILPSLFSIKRLKGIIEIFYYGFFTPKIKSISNAELLSIAVDSSFRGEGIAEKLYDRLKHHFEQKKMNSFSIIVGSSLEVARSFYERMGANAIGEIEVHSGKDSVIYIQELL